MTKTLSKLITKLQVVAHVLAGRPTLYRAHIITSKIILPQDHLLIAECHTEIKEKL